MFCVLFCFFFKQKTAYEMRISDWSSDVCSSDLLRANACMNRGVANNPALADFSASRFELRLDERNQACGRRRKAEGPLQHLRKRDEAGITDNKINGLRDMLPRQKDRKSTRLNSSH